MILEADRRDIADVISAGSGLSDGVKPSKVVDSMVESGWIDELDGHLYLHDWDEWQEMYYRFIDKREKDTARKRRAREAEKEAAGLPRRPHLPRLRPFLPRPLRRNGRKSPGISPRRRRSRNRRRRNTAISSA